jgi:hypothetical protein
MFKSVYKMAAAKTAIKASKNYVFSLKLLISSGRHLFWPPLRSHEAAKLHFSALETQILITRDPNLDY